MRGPKPKSEAVKAQRAPVRSKRKRAEPVAEVVSAGGVKPPTWLKDGGLRIWDRLAPTLSAAKLLSPADAETFGRYCRNFARWLKLQDELDAEGETYETETYLSTPAEGEAVKANRLKRANPAFLISDRLERQLLAAEDRFGLNPAERQRIFAARSQSGVSGDLFEKPASRQPDPATPAAQAARPISGPVGLLN